MPRFTISREDWSLHRKGHLDRQRHREKVREAIQKNLSSIITEESIVMSDGQKTIKVPIRSIKQYCFRFNYHKKRQVGQGEGNTEVGELIGYKHQWGDKGFGKGAGREPGIDYYETDITIEELEDILFEDLRLPNFETKKKRQMVADGIDFKDIRKKGLVCNLDWRRTILEVLKKNALRGHPGFYNLTPEDLRYRTWDVVHRPDTSAVILAMMDTSGSMGPFEKYIARSFFFWVQRFLRTKYRNVEIVYLAHHTEAKETNEDEFFTKGESGGTRCSSVYRKALEIIDERYPPADHNIYAFHFSDGDNLSSDNELCLELVRKLVSRCSLVGYGEIEGPYYYTSTLRTTLNSISDKRFITVVIREKGEVYDALKKFFG
ncbi:MAG: sporulation protein YhbH [Peptococcaceae bacterium]|nr:sporulation protein YhbH [Peptococcaceae bacterium]